MENNIIKFSSTKRFVGTWNGNAIEIKDTQKDKSVFIKYGVKNREEAETILLENIISLEEKPIPDMIGNSEFEILLNDFRKKPTAEKENNLKMICFCLKKMEYVNKKLYGVKKILEQLEEAGIKIEKGYNPFESTN